MNREKTTKQSVNKGDNILSPNHSPKAVRKRPNRKTVLGLFLGMLISGALILILGLLLLILPMFRVQKVEVEGLEHHTYEEILKASGIREGDEILALDSLEIIKRIYAECDYVEQAWIKKTPFSIKIIIKERSDIKTVAQGENTIVFDRDFLVLQILKNGETPQAAFLRVDLPAYGTVRVGETIPFADADADYSYINRLCDALKARDWYNDVTYADFSGRTTVAFIYRDHIRIEVGSTQDIDTKLLLAAEIMKEQEKNGVDLDSVYAILDVHSVEEHSWRLRETLEDLYQ